MQVALARAALGTVAGCLLRVLAGANAFAEVAPLVTATTPRAGRREDLRSNEEGTHHRGPKDEVGNGERGIPHEAVIGPSPWFFNPAKTLRRRR
jgi:hypothetical protein